MNIKSLDKEKKEFYSFALYIQDDRGYRARWLNIIYREYFGENLPQTIKDTGKPRKPSKMFMEWLDSTLIRNSNDAAKIATQRLKNETPRRHPKKSKKKK